MKIVNETISVKTHRRNEMIDITLYIQTAISQSGVASGMVVITCPHTTAAITINENADPDVPHDILLTLAALIPQLRGDYRHNEGNSDAHVKSSLFGCSEIIYFSDGILQLETWQAVFFCEFDGPRNRTAHIRILG